MAGQDYDKVISSVLSHAPPGQEAFLLSEKGEELRVRGDTDAALACFDRALRHDVALASAWVGRSRVLSAKQRDNEALGCVNRALDADPKNFDALAQKAVVMKALGAGQAPPPRSERKSLRKSITEDPLVARKSDPALALGPGVSQSVPPKRPSISMSPPGSGAARRVTQAEIDIATIDEVRSLILATRHVEALRKLEPLAQRLPGAREPWLLRAQILFAIGRHDAALTSAERVLKIDPKDVDALVLTVRALAAVGKDVKALEVMERLVAFAPTSADVLRLHGDCLVAAIRQADAVRVYQRVIELTPEDGRAYLALGKALRQLRRATEARVALHHAVTIAESSGDATLGALAREVLGKIPT